MNALDLLAATVEAAERMRGEAFESEADFEAWLSERASEESDGPSSDRA